MVAVVALLASQAMGHLKVVVVALARVVHAAVATVNAALAADVCLPSIPTDQ